MLGEKMTKLNLILTQSDFKEIPNIKLSVDKKAKEMIAHFGPHSLNVAFSCAYIGKDREKNPWWIQCYNRIKNIAKKQNLPGFEYLINRHIEHNLNFHAAKQAEALLQGK